MYATLAFAVGQRKREIAIRLALGSDPARVGGLVVRRGAFVVLVGRAAGLALSLAVGPILASMLYAVSPHDPLTLVAGPSILVVVALVAIWLPTRHAAGSAGRAQSGVIARGRLFPASGALVP